MMANYFAIKMLHQINSVNAQSESCVAELCAGRASQTANERGNFNMSALDMGRKKNNAPKLCIINNLLTPIKHSGSNNHLTLRRFSKSMEKYKLSVWTDEMLLDLVRLEDDRDAFAELYDRYWKPLLNMAGKRIPSMPVVEEIVQDVFADLYIRRKAIRVESSLEAYLKTATKYQIYKTYRAQQVHETYVSTLIPADQAQPDRPDTILEAKQLREKILRAIETMPETCREVFLLSRFEQLSNRDIAERLDISVAMVRKHITKGMNVMRSEFREHQPDMLSIALFIYLGNFI
ncbi:RNA polymerase sigma factor [Sphingobacterium hotanense]|uniref:RNA polymerase sigma factor n=1 Tax=Sphingobacterium hotanense TaxID=649196 RepID=UPI0021A53547|nr:RNA polymerase sigma-70 factor [Sphingobacterium hotanense]MCT1526124.1 RNA polymerase sigma-70 factor [Sphingobacterium hotanense]